MSASEDWDAWDELEATWDEREQERVDLVRIRGFALACVTRAKNALAAVVRAEEGLARARRVLETEVQHANAACDLAERMAIFAERARAGDVEPETRREAASSIERMCG